MKNALLAAAAVLVIGGIFQPSPLRSHERVTTTVTYDKEIVRILNRKCIACHSDNNLGVPLTTYEQTRPWARAIEEEVLRRHMPPWRAVPGYGQFVNDVGLTNRELQSLVAWVEGAGPKSKDDRIIVNLDQRQTPETERLRADFSTWQLGQPDLVRMLEPSAVAPGRRDEVKRVTVDMGLTADRWVRALEFKPGDRRVVRAAFFSLQETGQWLGSWTPWYGVTTLPADTAYRVPAGSHVIAEIHYRGAEQPVEDQGTLGLYFAPTAPKQTPSDLTIEAPRAEVPGAASQKYHRSMTLQAATTLLSFKPDVAPGVGSMEVKARMPDGRAQVLLLLRDILPEWPTPYIFKDPLPLPRNTELSITAYPVASKTDMAPASVALRISAYNTESPAATTQ